MLGWLLLSASSLALAACLLNDKRCDANQVALPGDLTVCECAEGTVRDPRGYGCKPCGDNEEVIRNQCACKSGFARNKTSGLCEESLLGAACDATHACLDSYPLCATDRGPGYCTTQGCATSKDCAEGWACQQATPMNYCSRPPSGQGIPCTSGGGQCDGKEAAYCEAVESQTCLVPNCASGENKCFPDYICCDITMVVPDIPSLCVPPEALDDKGECPLGVRKVMQ